MYDVWKEKVRLIAGLALNREVYARSFVTAYKTHGVAMKAMAARATRVSWVYVDALNRESVRSIAQTGTPCFFFTFYSTLMVKTYNKRKL